MMGLVNDWMKYVATITATLMILSESYLKRNTLSNLYNLVGDFEQKMLELIPRKTLIKSSREFYKRFSIKFGLFSFFYFLAEAYILPLLFMKDYSRTTLYFFCNSGIIMLCRYRHLQQIFFIDLLKHLMELLIVELKKGAKKDIRRKRIKHIQEMFRIPSDINKLQGQFFGLSQSTNFIFNYLQLLGDSYWIYWRYLNGRCNLGFYSKAIDRYTFI